MSNRKLTPAQRQLMAALRESEGEKSFDYYWNMLNGLHSVSVNRLYPVLDWQFDKSRDWTVDRGFPDSLVAVEIEGYSHKTTRYETDIEKYNAMAEKGIVLFRITRKLLEDNPLQFVSQVYKTVTERKGITQKGKEI